MEKLELLIEDVDEEHDILLTYVKLTLTREEDVFTLRVREYDTCFIDDIITDYTVHGTKDTSKKTAIVLHDEKGEEIFYFRNNYVHYLTGNGFVSEVREQQIKTFFRN